MADFADESEGDGNLAGEEQGTAFNSARQLKTRGPVLHVAGDLVELRWTVPGW